MAGPESTRQLLEALPQRFSQFDLRLAWAVKANTSETVVEGVVENLRFAYMEELEIRIVAVDGMGAVIGRSTCFVLPRQLQMNAVTTFTVKLPTLTPGTRLRFTYKYRGSDGGEGGMDWMQTFESVVLDTTGT